MMLTTDEAGDKRCTPYAVVRLLDRDQRDALMAQGSLSFNCIGSRCMQWRWAEDEQHALGKNPYGYCGLAGKP